jgi:hypothetical protein
VVNYSLDARPTTTTTTTTTTRWPPGCRSSLSIVAAANRSRPKSQYLQCQRSPTNSTHPYSTDATHHPDHTSVLSLLLRSTHESAPDLQILRVPNILTPAFDQMSLLLCPKPQCHDPLPYLERRKGSSGRISPRLS